MVKAGKSFSVTVAVALALSLVMALCLPQPVNAAEFHVTTAVEFQAALDAAENNGEDDIIYLAAGLYTAGTQFLYQASATEDHSLTIQAEPGLTRDQVILDGENDRRILRLEGYADLTSSHLTVKSLTFQNGNFDGYGAGLYLDTNGDIIVEYCVFLNNIATSRGGGLYAESHAGDIRLQGNRFQGNNGEGAGVFLYCTKTVTLVENVITGNTSPDSTGGGIYLQAVHNLLERNLIIGNQAASSGGGMKVYVVSNDSTVTLINNVIAHNTSGADGGGTLLWTSYANSRFLLINNTIYGNQASTYGGGIRAYALGTGEIHFYNNIAYNNNAGNSGGDIYLSGFAQQLSYNNDYSDMYGSWTDSGSNLDVDPVFVAPASDDYHLTAGSPCIDAGTTAVPDPPGLPATDIEGNPRVSGAAPDMGAYETQVWDPWAYDENEDGEIQKMEAIHAIQDYFSQKITKAQAIEVVMLYFG